MPISRFMSLWKRSIPRWSEVKAKVTAKVNTNFKVMLTDIFEVMVIVKIGLRFKVTNMAKDNVMVKAMVIVMFKCIVIITAKSTMLTKC